ncbi:phospholipase [Streptomonospora sp. PA3]|uniref:alpha/beta hydrolase n=1 Tax=Streptomonospora sp. PA3 TaxID=2607326 RepID=UPI0012DFD58E|nr:dienelactone hydrolase family protein [Streptomonospora sp. PA3]MUL41092.1 phospholipase [Streptomonospora sp. PA3]
MSGNPHLAVPPSHHGAALGEAGVVVYAVHGRGQSAEYMRDVARRVDLDGAAWVLPQAAEHTWYPGGFMLAPERNRPRLDQALEAVGTHLAELSAAPAPVAVFGFSQGACLLAEYLLTRRPGLAGAVLHTGGYMGPQEREWAGGGAGLAGMPVLMATAERDEWVPLHRVHATAAALSGLGARVTCDIYDDTEHRVNDDAVDRIRAFLRRLARPPR